MSDACPQFKDLIPRSLAADLSPEEQRRLDRHLAECAPCRREQGLYEETLRQLAAAGDDPVPRHFFVHPEASGATPWQVFRRMARAWQAAAAAAFLLLGVLSAAAIAKLQVRAGEGVLTVGFGRLPDRPAAAAPAALPDPRELEARVLMLAEGRTRRLLGEWAETWKMELDRMRRAAGREQAAALARALAGLEARMDAALTMAALELERRNHQAIDELDRKVALERARDLAAVDDRIRWLAVSGEVKSTETDAILQTLLQAAELKFQPYQGGTQ